MLYTKYSIFELYNNNEMKDEDKKKADEQKEEFSTELTGTFFDTFEFSDKSAEISTPETTKKEEEAKEKLEDDKSKEAAKTEETKKEEEPEKKEEEKKEEIPEETQKEYDAVAEALKAKDEKDLDDDEKDFLKSYEDGTLGEAEKEETKEESGGYADLAKTLIDKGILEESEELEDTEESFQGVISKTVEAKVDEYIAEIPQEYRNIIDFMRTGGKADEYLQAKATIDYANLDLKNEQIQTTLVKADLEQQGYTPEEVAEKIQDYKDLERMEKEATKSSKVFEKQQTDRITAYDAQIQKQIDDQKKADDKEVEEVEEAIDSMEEIAGFKLTPKRKDAFKKYLFEVDANGETAASKASKEVDNRIKLYFMDFVGYNFDDLERAVTTKKTKDFRKILSRYKDTATQTTGVSVKEVDPAEEQQELKIPSMFNRAEDDD